MKLNHNKISWHQVGTSSLVMQMTLCYWSRKNRWYKASLIQ